MKIRISNMLRVQEAEFVLEPGRITTVTGRNASGKTSLATIAGALCAGTGNPVGASKGQGKVYLRDSADSGSAELFDNNGGVIVRWLAQTGELARLYEDDASSSPAGVGLIDFCSQMSPTARVGLWEEYFLPPPEVLEERIRKALAPHVPATLLEDLMEHARTDSGFDGIVKAYQTRARDAKRSWTHITGEEWGVKKAADWLPGGWLADLDGTTFEAADHVVDEAQAAVQSGQIAHAVSATIIAQAREAAERIPHAQVAYNTAERAHGEAVLSVQNALDANKPALDAIETAEHEARQLADERDRITRELTLQHRDKPKVPDGDSIVDDNASLAAGQRIHRFEQREPQRGSFTGSGIARRAENIKYFKINPPRPARACSTPCHARRAVHR